MKYVTVRDINTGPCAYMPLWVWNLTGWLCKHNDSLGLLGGFIMSGYRFYFADKPQPSTAFILWESVRLWWGCRYSW